MNPRHLALILWCLPTLATAATEHTIGQWTGLFLRKDLTETLTLHQEFQIRTNYETGNTTQSLFRAGPLWKLSDQTEIGMLYVFSRAGLLTEHRLTEQVVYKFSETFTARFRFEQRTMEKLDGMSLRARVLARFVWPINDSHSLVAWDEYFAQPTRPQWIYDELFDRNRYFLGARSKWNYIAFEYGYMNQFINRAGRDASEHLFLIYFIL